MSRDSETADLDPGEVILIRLQKEREAEPHDPEVVERYCREHPEHADELREFDALQRLLDGSPPAPGPPEPPAPERLGDFRIVRRIAHGGMGVIYEAVQEPLNRRVAVKTIRGGGDEKALQDRFLREQETLARLHHTHIVPIHAAGRMGGLRYFAMPYIEGASLDRVIAAARSHATSGRAGSTPTLAELASSATSGEDTAADTTDLSKFDDATSAHAERKPVSLSNRYLRSVVQVLIDAADALHYAHDAGVVHRDLKPANLMIDGGEHCCSISDSLHISTARAGPHSRSTTARRSRPLQEPRPSWARGDTSHPSNCRAGSTRGVMCGDSGWSSTSC